jgi:hypothetical protein
LQIEISSSTQKHTPIYNLSITYYNASNPSVPNTVKISRPFTQWFDAAGQFVPLPFQQMFASEVPVIGKADPTKAVKVDGKLVQPTPDIKGQGLDGIRATGVNVSEGKSSATPRKGAKNRRKA